MRAVKSGLIDENSHAVLDSTAHSLKFVDFQNMYFNDSFPPDYEVRPNPDLANKPVELLSPDAANGVDPAQFAELGARAVARKKLGLNKEVKNENRANFRCLHTAFAHPASFCNRAEAGVNHEGDMNIARRLIDEAAGSRRGCDQVPDLQGLHPGLEKILQLIGIQARNRQKASMSCSENTILSGKMSLKV